MSSETSSRCDCNCSIQQVWDSKLEKEILDSFGEPIEISESSEPIEINGNDNSSKRKFYVKNLYLYIYCLFKVRLVSGLINMKYVTG